MVVEKDKSFFGIGRRKSATARVRLIGGSGKLIINSKEETVYPKLQVLLQTVDRLGALDISVLVNGGGLIGQKDAIVLGTARGLVDLNPDFRSTLRKAGFLTRDPRIKERKKPGLKRARRAPQWAKR